MVLFKRWGNYINACFSNNNSFKSFGCKAELLGNTKANGNNGI